MKYTNLLLLTLLSFAISASSCQAQKKTTKTESKKEFSLPEIPTMITAPQERANFLVMNYWNNFDFSDATLITKPEITEQIFVDFINTLPHSSVQSQNEAINTMLDKAMTADSAMFAHFADLSEKYLYDPNSPMRNEELLIPVLRYIIDSPKVGEVDKIRPQYLLEMALKNRVGEIANDFVYTTKAGQNARLSSIKSDYTLIFFNNPGCQDCKRVKGILSSSPAFTGFFYGSATNRKSLTILAMYVDEDLKEWKEEIYPEQWINAYDKSQTIRKENLYDLKAIPTLYLLDREKRVIFKDGMVEQIGEWLSNNKEK